MKKLLQNLIKNETGSMFLYLFFLATLLLAFTITLFAQHQNERQLGQLELEHIQLEMIHQQAYQTILTDWNEVELDETFLLNFPNGEADITITDINQDYYKVNITAYTKPPYLKLKTYYLKKTALE